MIETPDLIIFPLWGNQRRSFIRWHDTLVHEHALDVESTQFKLFLYFPAVHGCGQVN